MLARQLAIAIDLATTKFEGNQKIVDLRGKATEILDKLINATDIFFSPAAFYYRAFILLAKIKTENEKKGELILTLRNAENILNDHIDMQIYFNQIHQSEQAPSFCVVDGYKKQKENNIDILEYLIDSIQSLLGSNYLSDLEIEEGLKGEAQEKEDIQKAKNPVAKKQKFLLVSPYNIS
jgi:hypothetical protein